MVKLGADVSKSIQDTDLNRSMIPRSLVHHIVHLHYVTNMTEEIKTRLEGLKWALDQVREKYLKYQIYLFSY